MIIFGLEITKAPTKYDILRDRVRDLAEKQYDCNKHINGLRTAITQIKELNDLKGPRP